jgi:hypothetical protein
MTSSRKKFQGGIFMPTTKKESVDGSIENKTGSKQVCFVIMPISDPEGYQQGHFKKIYNDIFYPAIDQAGFKPYRADDSKAANYIELEILKKLIECPMALCDLSSRNPNVLFELGIRQAFDKPVVLVQEYGTPKIFDISSINTLNYRKERLYDEVLEDQQNIKDAIVETFSSCNSGKSINSIIRLLSINQPAKLEDLKTIKQDPTIHYMISELASLRNDIRNLHFHGADMHYINSKGNTDTELRIAKLNLMRNKRVLSELLENGDKNSIIHFVDDMHDFLQKNRSMYKKTNFSEYRGLIDSYDNLICRAKDYLTRSDEIEKNTGCKIQS